LSMGGEHTVASSLFAIALAVGFLCVLCSLPSLCKLCG
jgi:hypothetical protein